MLITSHIKDVQFIVDISKVSHNGLNLEIRKVTVINKVTGTIINTFEDSISDVNKDSIIRTMSNKAVIHYENGSQLVYYPPIKPVPFIPSLVKDAPSSANFVALDLETVKMNDGNLVVESVAVSNGRKLWLPFQQEPQLLVLRTPRFTNSAVINLLKQINYSTFSSSLVDELKRKIKPQVLVSF
jgi:hypothetical protein